jgi:RNA polymerase sigma factor (sigma-70 family)
MAGEPGKGKCRIQARPGRAELADTHSSVHHFGEEYTPGGVTKTVPPYKYGHGIIKALSPGKYRGLVPSPRLLNPTNALSSAVESPQEEALNCYFPSGKGMVSVFAFHNRSSFGARPSSTSRCKSLTQPEPKIFCSVSGSSGSLLLIRMTDSHKLLSDYAKNGSEAAFREIVFRYLDLVHSAALRLVGGDTHRAQDVSQAVFTDLARKAGTLPTQVMLGGWLHQHTCFVAANTLRAERRRQERERQAVEMDALEEGSKRDFSRLAPLLDEAISELSEPDREAILLRFFEQFDFRKVGEATGSSEDAARMRVNRALEKLELLLKRRGITSTAAALSVALTANAVHAAPAGLAATISFAALSATVTSAAAGAAAAKTMLMTTLQKAVIAASLVVAATVATYQARQAAAARTESRALEQQQAPLRDQIEQLQSEKAQAAARLAALANEMESIKTGSLELPRLRAAVTQLANQLRAERAQSSEMRDQLGTLSNTAPVMALDPNGNLNVLFAATNPIARNMYAQTVQVEKAREIEKLQVLKSKLILSPEQEDQIRALLLQSVEDKWKTRTIGSLADLAACTKATTQLEEGIRSALSSEQQTAYEALQQGNASAAARLSACQELMRIQSALGLSEDQQTLVFEALHHGQALERVLTPSELQTYREYVKRHTFTPNPGAQRN